MQFTSLDTKSQIELFFMNEETTPDPFAEREAAKYENPIPSREFILEHIKNRGVPAKFVELVDELNLKDPIRQEALFRRLKAMVRDEQLERLKGGLYWPTGNRVLIEGRIAIEKGKVWVIPNDGSARIAIREQNRPLFSGNKVIASVVDTPSNEFPEGKIVNVIEQQAIKLTGRFVQEAGFAYVIPHSKEFAQDVLITKEHSHGAKDGHIVIIELINSSNHWAEPSGKIIEILGHEDSPGIEVEAAIHAYGLPFTWSAEVLQYIEKLKPEVTSAAKKGRVDLREVPLVTIDGEDAKDFDDAVYCEPKANGGWRLYVAIADVSYYVRPNTALDKAAQERGNSVYFPGKVIPMLPEILSNELCSLKPEVDRLCMVCEMQISNAGKLTRYEFYEGLMRSHARLTYTKVANILTDANSQLKAHYQELVPHLEDLHALYQVLRQAREDRGAIEFESIETKIIFGDNGKINRIEPVIRNVAHQIIEECMLCANVATARFLKKHKLPGLFRNHEGPGNEKLMDLRKFLNEVGLSLGGGKEPQPLDYAKLLASIQHRKDANIIQMVLLRSLSQAVYHPDNVGHFGLAYPAYCHFTSPIRRYPDLLTHRQIRLVLSNKWPSQSDALLTKKSQKSLEAVDEKLMLLGQHCSATERRADEATRDVLRWLKCEYIAKHVGKTFSGLISGVTRFGFFVELKDIYIDGLVHVTSLHNDYYIFDTTHHRLVGEHSGIIYKLGDSVTVQVARVDVDERKIDFSLLEDFSKRAQQALPHKKKSKPKIKSDATNKAAVTTDKNKPKKNKKKKFKPKKPKTV